MHAVAGALKRKVKPIIKMVSRNNKNKYMEKYTSKLDP